MIAVYQTANLGLDCYNFCIDSKPEFLFSISESLYLINVIHNDFNKMKVNLYSFVVDLAFSN